ncbi:isoleucyl-tRNA synthetase [Sphingomonas sp. BE270]|jgi:isoleucyl-tRNA synthetase|uniref:isoleucine--tRNA ligase n=1 Tax=unclassified Sphingomonas TaxID=196159 RepID=UPI0010F9DEA8|nr:MULTISPECIES: isoleucine--tRNA ligase [unclassified Sphingomonas]MDR6847061.1 isoleucyl-tRNA synthetase [Sphingomonas sp. BE137]MDR7256662.1 isoleucyl-tRNA synthetase [Sphingomonas sp. BE270]
MTDASDTTPARDAQRDWRDTVFLPKTDFPMKAGLPAKEPGILARWQAMNLYEKTREARRGREKFILHDGPPYANGDMHIGHALNHILKDTVCRTQTLLGKDAPYVPGWDCHGLPIEWKVEEQYRAKKRNKDEVPAKEFRAECRAYAQHWVDVQREQLKRLGINGDWDHPYLTMDFQAEATIVSELLKFAESGQLYRGAKPVMWSPVEKTALAEAEVEYEDVVSTQIDVAFEIVDAPNAPELVGAHAVIWTTTPWTIPVNQALSYGPEIEYRLFRIGGWKLLVADGLVETFYSRLSNPPIYDDHGPEGRLGTIIKGSQLEGATARHPMHALGGFFAKPRPFLPGEFVTTDAGTGLVHMAPDHGEDDFLLCKQYGIDPVFAVDGAGMYRADWAWLGGQGSVINKKFVSAEGPICSDLRAVGALLAASDDFAHSYPHSWRSKAKVIFRATPQWFIPMDQELPSRLREGLGEGGAANAALAAEFPPPTPPAGGRGAEGETLRSTALRAIEATTWYPPKGQNRITAMVAGRPDWVISRQRAWGVPITLFVNRTTGQYLVDPEVNRRIVAAVREQGVDAWSEEAAQDLLGADYTLADYERVTDILDVWFDSGCTHAFVLESGRWPDLQWPADLYLEGSDQHRGWFQSSLMEACGTRGRAPYDAVLTHGFTMDAKGMKMSKSLGNTINPLDLMKESGADILRLWALSVDFTEDHRIGKEILNGVSDQYRKLRNTFRYLLGALEGFDEAERLPVADMPELERYMLHLLAELDAKLRAAVEVYDFNSYVRLLTEFAQEDLSAFYFDIRKDSLYCDGVDDPKRRGCRTVFDTLFHALVRYAAPVLCFTAEEVWQDRFPSEDGSVHLLEWPEVPAVADVDAAHWVAVRALRTQVTEAIEPLRREKIVRSSLEAEVVVPEAMLSPAALAELFIVAKVTTGEAITVSRTDFHKCGRCWRHLPEVAVDRDLCDRCTGVVA